MNLDHGTGQDRRRKGHIWTGLLLPLVRILSLRLNMTVKGQNIDLNLPNQLQDRTDILDMLRLRFTGPYSGHY